MGKTYNLKEMYFPPSYKMGTQTGSYKSQYKSFMNAYDFGYKPTPSLKPTPNPAVLFEMEMLANKKKLDLKQLSINKIMVDDLSSQFWTSVKPTPTFAREPVAPLRPPTTYPPLTHFLTGSRAYGTPTPESDWDVVVRCDVVEDLLLRSQSDDRKAIRFGKLNIITAVSDKTFAAWAHGTHILMEIAPVTREFAIAVFESLGLRQGELLGEYPGEVQGDLAPMVKEPENDDAKDDNVDF